MSDELEKQELIEKIAVRYYPGDIEFQEWVENSEYPVDDDLKQRLLSIQSRVTAKQIDSEFKQVSNAARKASKQDEDYTSALRNNFWKIPEAAKLLLGFSLSTVFTARPSRMEDREIRRKYDQPVEQLGRAYPSFRYSTDCTPMAYLLWAEQNEFSVPPALLVKILRRENRDRKKKKNFSFIEPKIETSTPGELYPKERESLLKLIIGMAVEQYNYDPKAMRNDATKHISDDLDANGISLDRDTILKWLREASELLPPKN